MKRRTNKKGFTIVELVIVIAVIAILATTLVPTFGDVIAKAQESAAKQAAKNAYTSYMVENAASGNVPAVFLYEAEEGRVVAIVDGAAVGVYESREAALSDVIGEDFEVEKLTATTDGKLFAYGGVVTQPSQPQPTDPSQPEEPVETDWTGATAVFVGDSITQASGIANPYHKLVEAQLGLNNFAHMGIGGSCISVTSNYGQTYTPLINRYQNIPNADLIVIFMGTNDFGHNTPLGTISDTTDVSFYGALNVIISGVKAAHSNSQIVFMTPLHRAAFNSQPADNVQNGAGCVLADYVGAIKDVCDRNNIPVIDLFNLCTLDPNNTTYFSDKLHPTAKGHEELANIVAEELKKIPRKEGAGDTPVEPEPPVEADPEVPNYTLIYGNRFVGNQDTNRLSTERNIFLTKGTVVTIKENSKYEWAISPETGYNSTNLGSQYISNGWDEGGMIIIPEDGWYGFTIKKNGDAAFDFASDSSLLTDYFYISAPEKLTMVTGNVVANLTGSNRHSAAYNLYFRKGTVITFNKGTNGATGWALSKAYASADDLTSKSGYVTGMASNGANGGWAADSEVTFTVPEDGYYRFVVAFGGNTDLGDYTILDYFTISGFDNAMLVQGNRMTSDSTSQEEIDKIPKRISSEYNLYLVKGTVITFKPGNGATEWALTNKMETAVEKKVSYLTNVWTNATTYTVQESGYYALILKNDQGITAENYDLFDFFEITGYTK